MVFATDGVRRAIVAIPTRTPHWGASSSRLRRGVSVTIPVRMHGLALFPSRELLKYARFYNSCRHTRQRLPRAPASAGPRSERRRKPDDRGLDDGRGVLAVDDGPSA